MMVKSKFNNFLNFNLKCKKVFNFLWFIFLFINLFLVSCIKAPSSKRVATILSSNSTTKSTTNLPVFQDGNNYFQNAGSVYTSTFNLPITFADSFYFRGKDVDNYIRNSNLSTPICMLAKYDSIAVKKVIILTLIPRSVYNYTNQSLEYYYSVSPADTTTNQNFCQKTGLTNFLSTNSQFQSLTPYYSIGSLCLSSNCSATGYTSAPIQLYTSAGIALTNIKTTTLLLYVTSPTSTNTQTGSTCTSNAECTTQGYDCCSGNQCVKDLQQKGGIDLTSSDYKQALQDILNNPNAIYNYPQYYYICSQLVNQPGTSTQTSTSTATSAAQKRLTTMASYYNCANKINGEAGLCSTTIPNAVIGAANSIGIDDRSFSNTFSNINIDTSTLTTIEKIYFGEVLLYDYNTKTDAELSSSIYSDDYLTINGQHNDDIITGATVTVKAKPLGAVSNELIVYYKNDASCTSINASLAKCEKYYIQGQKNFGSTIAENRLGRVTDHYPASNIFKLPNYAITSQNVKVELDGVTLINGTDWTLTNSSPSYVTLIPNNSGSLRAQDSQLVKITFFADPTAMDSKLKALKSIQAACSCADLNCNLAPIKNTSGNVMDYACVYAPAIPPAVPLSQTAYLSAKSVPVRYYDSAGVSQTSVNATNLAQEGIPFSYTNNDLSKPSNLSGYVGLNEVYGSLSFQTNSAKPPKEINVTKGNSYDIYVDNGAYYSCANCGSDYYSQINKLFPSMQNGGGLTPMRFQTDRYANSSSNIRADEFSFGRACFVPATMLPWSHYIASDVTTQRSYRQSTQHFLFANGYQRDWYGFDYGAVIGSFDGVKWFAVGTQRRIKATSNKLFLAINGYTGDLTVDSTYNITVNDATLNSSGAGVITTDIENDGAECQKYHVCSTDNDCYASLGPDYTCSVVSDITTTWPVFDDNANEIPEKTVDNNQFVNILGIGNPGKRCTYRGRGALCTPNYGSVNTNSTFNQSTDFDFHACSTNNYCQNFATSGTLNSNFNNRVNRFGKKVVDSTLDSFGFGAPITMRPFSYNGNETIRTQTLHNLSAIKTIAMCIPGKSPEVDSFAEQNYTIPTSSYMGDRVIGLGSTKSGLSAKNDYTYYAACGTFNSSGDYSYKTVSNPTDKNSLDTILINESGSQNISSNALYILKTILDNKKLSSNILSSPNTILSSFSILQNTCLRAPGASCNTNLDCAPSKPITDKTKLLSATDTSVTSILNSYEIKFWQEPLVCSQLAAQSTLTLTDTLYDPKNNKCCREVGNIITIGQNSNTTNPLSPNYQLGQSTTSINSTIPTYDIALNAQNRYSRNATIFNEMKNDNITYPNLYIPIADGCSGDTNSSTGCFSIYDSNGKNVLTNQFNTFSKLAEKTSCSNNWIRSFADGTHIWNSSRMPIFDPTIFRCYNWAPVAPSVVTTTGTANGFSCKNLNPNDVTKCALMQNAPTTAKSKAILKFLAKLDLMGIPQIAIPTEEAYISDLQGDLSCSTDPINQGTTYPSIATNNKYIPPYSIWKNFNYSSITSTSTPPNVYTFDKLNNSKREFWDSLTINPNNGNTGIQMYSAIDASNFNSKFAPIFKSDEVTACLPAGTTMTNASDFNKCCTGFINQTNLKCALPDGSDISVYTNKYVSSEGNGLSDTFFDDDGYIKDPSHVAQLACAKSICASGKVTYGILISQLLIPGLETTSTQKYYRFLEGADADNVNNLLSIYKTGLVLNNHAYCLPVSNNAGTSTDLSVISCN